jgi:betaine-aldehyde dehydrogenase
MGDLTHYPMIIGSEFVTTGSENLLDPSTEQPFATVATGTPDDVADAIAQAKTAQVAWGNLSYGERSLALLRFADALADQGDRLARLESQNTGKPLKLSLGNDIPFGIDNFRYFASVLRYQDGAAAGEYVGGYTSMVRREPIGVVGAITPWNYPFMMAAWKLAPALAAGNAVVIKPAPHTPISTIELAKIALQVGLPPGLINVVTGHVEVGEAICTHPDVNMISFTGSTRTGQRIGELASQNVKRVALELGGKAPLIVFADADLEAAVQGAVVGAYMNTGQDCAAATRLYVQNEVFDAFLERFVHLSGQLTLGEPFSEETNMGPLTSQTHRDRVHHFVETAKQEGIALKLGGAIPERPGYFYPPTIFVDAPQSASCVQDEVFGPVVVVNRFSDEQHAIQLGNDIAYGLGASVWTQNVQRALRVSAALKFGTVWVNDHLPLASEMPNGVYKQSGMGYDLSHYALQEYTVVKHVMLDNTGDRSKAWHSVMFNN